MFLMPFFWLIIIAGIVLVVLAVTPGVSKTGVSQTEETALDILKKRYARGEIDAEEYQEKKRILA